MRYDTYLKRGNLADSTIGNYMWTFNYFNNHYPELIPVCESFRILY